MTCLCRHRGEVEVHLQTIRNPAQGDGWSAPRSGRLTPGKDPVPIARCCIAGWVGLGTGLDLPEEFASSGIRVPDRPGRRELLWQLSYPGRICRRASISIGFPLGNLEVGSSTGDFERWMKGALGIERVSLKRLSAEGLWGGLLYWGPWNID
jgi:hypothetical protein